MSLLITAADLEGMNEQELRALYGRIIADLQRHGQSAFLNPLIYASLRNIEVAIARLQAPRAKPPKGPGL
jgi:hypothetical protein